MQDKKALKILLALGAAMVTWFSLLISPYVGGKPGGIISGLNEAIQHPFSIHLCEDSLKTVLALLLVYGIAVGVVLTNERNYRRREEHGSAKWGDPVVLAKRYTGKSHQGNKILTQNISMSYKTHRHRRNMNTLVVGGSGSGKTRFYAKPNILNEVNNSLVITDPKGELVRSTGAFLESQGYTVKVIDLIRMERSHCYNPFVYLQNENDIQRLVTNLFKNTTPKGAQTQDPFWDQAAMMLLLSLIFYLHYEAPPEEQNFSMVLDMIRAGDVMEDDDTYQSPLDLLFDRLEMRNPEHVALKYYRSYRSGSGKTLKSIQITLMSRLDKFNLDSLAGITQYDELELQDLGRKKTAIFAVIPDNDSSFNFLIGMLYTQMFQQLEYLADNSPGLRLPVHVHFIMDEFANVALPDEFEKTLATIRSREISVSIIIQNMAQLKALFDKTWESIEGNCDEYLYLGGNEQSTHKYISEKLGKETIDLNTYGQSKGRSGSYSTNWQITGRELLTPDEVRLLDNSDALLFIRGERPVKDKKYDLLKHPNIALSEDGGAEPYRYGEDALSIASVSIIRSGDAKPEAINYVKHDFLVYTEGEMQEIIKEKTEEQINEQE